LAGIGGLRMMDVCSSYYDVLKIIKLKQQELIELGSLYELTNRKVIECSQELDVLINLIQFEKDLISDVKELKEKI
jgi:hypothetical protein